MQAMRFHRDPLGFLQRSRSVHGDAFTVDLAVAGRMVVLTKPADIQELLATSPEDAHGGEARRRIVRVISPHSVLGADGDQHRSARARVARVFAPEAMDARRSAMAEIAERHVAGWPLGRPLRLLPRMRALVDEIFAQLVVGVRDVERARALAGATQRMLWTPGNPPLPPPGEGAGLLGELGKRVFERRKDPAARLLMAELRERRARAQPGGAPNLIDAMLDGERPPTLDEATDQLLPLLMAGQEPPAAALTWVLDRLSRETGLAEEYLALPDESPRRDAIVRETLRLRPAVHSVVRRLTRPQRLGDHDLPAGAVAMGSIVLAHRDPEAYPDGDSFRPERFLAEDAEKLPHLPFGGGARRCLGEPLAHAQIGAALPTILRRLEMRPISSDPERMVVRGTVLVPQRSGLVVSRSRPRDGGRNGG